MTGRSYTFAFGALTLEVPAANRAEAVNRLKSDLQQGGVNALLSGQGHVSHAYVDLTPEEITEDAIVSVQPPENPA